ncbi:MAG: hypothetical protein KJ057_14000 [Phycisphaerae bacterium]|nr:MAG: hypothetical protein EDS66_11380 [Planctomycetota bacterium]KAB2948177.1 MAG: hypothetical protein F9K17_06525 [Phycisphaerae bacterium]MBE7458499.1 hypothetical protein [Planctomycetia bacterium]MCK6465891.1 hypothetical protein [Phycisphaerae bacterium]MCL4719579.1 hypothetical protein [Phycisphaerae bacterium]
MKGWDARRRRIWRRAWAGVGLVTALLLSVRIWWGAVAHERLTRAVEAYRAVGEPVFIEDFLPPTGVPDDRNAAKAYEKAAGMIVVPDAMQVVGTHFFDDFRWARAYPDDARLVVEANAGMLAELHRASALVECDWGVRIVSPIVNTILPTISWTRHLSRSAAPIAVSQHVIGDDEGMMRTLSDLHMAHRRLGEGRTTFAATMLAAQACEGLRCSAIEFAAPRLQIERLGTGGETGDAVADAAVTVRPAKREQIRDEVARLLEEDWIRQAWGHAMNTERASLYDFAVNFGNPTFMAGMGIVAPLSGRPVRWLIGPSFDLDAARGMARFTRVRDAGRAASYRQATVEVGIDPLQAESLDKPGTQIERAARLVSLTLMWGVERTLNGEFRLKAQRRMAAAALAIRMYEVDHGRRPASLDELVPEYLPGVPEDPFADRGAPIRYTPDADPPVLYSVGPDGTDDGGHLRRLENGAPDDSASDILFYLDGDRPRDPLDLSKGLKTSATSTSP